MISVSETILEGTSLIRRGIKSKRAAVAGAASIRAAGKKNDPLYSQLKKLNAKRIALKQRLEMKYKMAGRIAARKVR